MILHVGHGLVIALLVLLHYQTTKVNKATTCHIFYAFFLEKPIV